MRLWSWLTPRPLDTVPRRISFLWHPCWAHFYPSVYGAVSEQFQSSFRTVSKQFLNSLRTVSEQFLNHFSPVSEQFQSEEFHNLSAVITRDSSWRNRKQFQLFSILHHDPPSFWLIIRKDTCRCTWLSNRVTFTSAGNCWATTPTSRWKRRTASALRRRSMRPLGGGTWNSCDSSRKTGAQSTPPT